MVEQPKKFSIKFKIYWALAAFGTGIISTSYGGMLTIFYQDYMGLSASWIATAAWIYAIWNAFNDPLFGFLSDKSRSKKGRRIPFMRYTAPFLGLTFILVWLVPPTSSDTMKFWWMLASMFAYDTAYTIIGLVYSALLPELTENDNERGSLSTYSSLFSLLGTIMGFLLPDIFRAGIDGTNYTSLYLGMGGIGLVGAIFIFITTLKVKERPEFTLVDEPLPLWESIKYTFKSKSFLILASANFMSILMSSLVMGSLFYLADYVLLISGMEVIITFFLGIIAGVLLVNLIAKKIGMVQTQQFMLVGAGLALCLITFVGPLGIMICLAVAGFGLSGPLVITNVLFAQVADEDELESGVRREAMFFGVNALLTKPAQSVALALVPWILELTAFQIRIDGEAQPQLDPAKFGIKLFIGLIPGIAILLGALILHWYPLRGEKLDKMREQILTLHAEKKVKLNEL
ncbi:MAG: MFS transporter [Promethearchaeota archaeon]